MKLTDNFLKWCLDPLSSHQINVKFSVMRRSYSLLHGPFQGRDEFDSLRLSEDELNADPVFLGWSSKSDSFHPIARRQP